MNRFIQKIVCVLVIALCSITISYAQKGGGATKGSPTVAAQRCGTDEAIARQYQTDPAYRAMIDQREAEYQAWKASNRGQLGDLYRTSLLTGPVTIPTVVHIVTPNPETITDADVDFVINKLNEDFSGLNADSANGAVWYPVRGHSLIRFCLAKRDPNGNATTGIERKVGTTGIAGGEPQPVKNSATATGGFTAWDPTRYYNIWVCNGGSLLGIAPAIGVGTYTGATPSDGVVVSATAFANNPCRDQPPFNLGRTLVHEVGHNFGLFHTFQGGCGNGDNGQLTSAGCTFPPSILSLPDQSPAQSGATSGCPTVGAASANTGCADPNPPGRQFQNYMDYTDDACYSMFNQTQVERMHWLLENCRAGYLTSNGCTPPAGIPAFDGSILNFVSPGGSVATNTAGMCLTNYPLPTCPGAITPRVMVFNAGTTTITSITISLTGPNGTTSGTYMTNIAYGKRAVVTLNNDNAIVGANTLTATITAINGSADAVAANNTATLNYNIAAPTALPRFADFVATTFPPANFTINTVSGTGAQTWVRNANGNITAGSTGIDFWNLASGNTRDLRTTPASFAAMPSLADSIIISFDVNHRQFSNEPDRLQLLYSLDCGATWLPTGFDKQGATLATNTPATPAYTTPDPTKWRSERVALRNASIAAGGVVQFAFRGISGYGNWLYIDNINIQVPVARDASVSSILTPAAQECGTSFTPRAEIKNNGTQTLTAFSVTYSIDGGTASAPVNVTTPLAPGATTIVTLPVATTTVGAHSIVATVSNVATALGTGDQNTTNDANTKAFTVRALATAPLVEGFEGTTFVPTGWALINAQNNNTWVRSTAGGGYATSSASMFIDNYNFNLVGQLDAVVTPPVNIVGADSVVVSFDLAHKNFAGFNDSLIVFVSKDCGATFQRTSFAQGGAGLATAGASTANYTAPVAADWRTRRVAIGGSLIAGSNSVLIAIANRCGYGNNIFVDNINIGLVFRRDIQPTVSVRPGDLECSGNFTPSVMVRNAGLDTVKSFTATYRLNAGAAQVTNVTGINLAPGAVGTYNLTPITGAAVGVNNIEIYTSNLVTHAGTSDQNIINDTLKKQFNVLPVVSAPLAQDFEGTFPPSGWGVVNADNGITWSAASTGYNSTKSATLQNYNYAAAATSSRRDDLISPNVTFSNVDSVYLSFDLAAKTRVYPGSTAVNMDSVQILISTDCGVTFKEVFNKWGEDLQTIADPNYSNIENFVPNAPSNWKNYKLNITGQTGTSSTGFVVIFRNKSNNDNNVYIDNINLNTVTLPAGLKQRGYAIAPSPFTSSFNILHYLPPTDLRFVEVIDASGRIVFRKQFGSNGANSNESIDLRKEAAGVYTVKMGYANKVISERIIKTN